MLYWSKQGLKGESGMTINYEYYRTFYYVARYGSFTKAADALFANQPNVTRTIGKLEDMLGCRLFLRTHHGVTLTPEGRLLYSHVSVAHEQLQLAEQELTDTTALRTGTVTIGTSTEVPTYRIDGTRTASNQRGIVIRNGQKVVVK